MPTSAAILISQRSRRWLFELNHGSTTCRSPGLYSFLFRTFTLYDSVIQQYGELEYDIKRLAYPALDRRRLEILITTG